MTEWRRLIFCLLSSMALVSFPANSLAVEVKKPGPHKLYGGVAANRLIDICSLHGVALSSTSGGPPFKIGKVLPGTAAWYQGLKEGDGVKDVQTVGTQLEITIERGGKTYTARLEAVAAKHNPLIASVSSTKLTGNANSNALDGAAQTGKTAPGEKRPLIDVNQNGGKRPLVDVSQNGGKRPVLDVNQPKDKIPVVDVNQRDFDPFSRMNEDYEVVVIVDKTGSMTETETPTGQSKWDWCRDETIALFNNDEKKNLWMLVPFNESYQMYRQVRLFKVASIYHSNQPNGFTNMGAPLGAVLEEWFSKPYRKPLLVAVLHDGLPNRPSPVAAAKALVEEAIVNATHKISSPDQLVITFLQIGDNYEGGEYLQYLDKNLPGTRFDVVDAIPFRTLTHIGLRQALIDSLTRHHMVKRK